MLILPYTIQLVILNVCTKFENPRCSSSWELFDTNFLRIGVRDGKKKKKKKRQNKFQYHGFLLHNILKPLLVYTKFEEYGSHRSWEICDKKFIGEKIKLDK